MNCPLCDEPGSSVYNSRKTSAEDGVDAIVTRYRKCSHCKTRWRTVERFEHLVTIEGKSLRPDKIKDGAFRFFGGTIHPFSAIAPEPYTLVSVVKPADGPKQGTCAHCDRPIGNVVTLRGSDGTEFTVGLDCAKSAGESVSRHNAARQHARRSKSTPIAVQASETENESEVASRALDS